MDRFFFIVFFEGMEVVFLCNINEVGRLEILLLWLKNILIIKYYDKKKFLE